MIICFRLGLDISLDSILISIIMIRLGYSEILLGKGRKMISSIIRPGKLLPKMDKDNNSEHNHYNKT